MNDSRKYKALRSAFIALICMGMPNILIQRYLNISPKSILNYLRRIKKEDSNFKGKTTPFKESVPRMLMLLPYLSFDGKLLRTWMKLENIQREKLLEIINELLGVEKIIEILDYSSMHLHNLKKFEFSPDVPEGYVNFLNVLNIHKKDFRCHGSELWYSYLENRVYAEKEEIAHSSDWKKLVIDKILSEVGSYVRNDVSQIFYGDVCQSVDLNLFETISQTESLVLKMYFGLRELPLSLFEISKRLNIKEAEVVKIKDNAIRHCKDEKHYHLIFTKSTVEERGMINSINDLKENLVNGGHELANFDFSVRALNILSRADIYTLEDLSLKKEEDLSKLQSMGKKTIEECKRNMEKFGLSFRK